MLTDKNAISYQDNYKENKYKKLFSLIINKAHIILSEHQNILDKLIYPEDGFWCRLMDYRTGLLEEERHFDTKYAQLEEENDNFTIFKYYSPIREFSCDIVKIKNNYYVHSSQVLITTSERIKLWRKF